MLPEEVTKLIGKTGKPVVLEVEKGAIRKFADAVGDRNPLYWDKEYATNSKFGSIIAPPGFFGWPVQWNRAMPFFSEIRDELLSSLSDAGFPNLLDGGVEFEFFLPVRPGDILVSVVKIADISSKQTRKGGRMVLSVTETSYTNQDGALVAVARQTAITRE